MKNSNHASKALAVVLSGALAFAPAANAALDENNMSYDSAAEGFYGSLRVQYANNESGGEDNDSTVETETSRLGVRGDVDLGGGLEAFYGFEWNLGDPANNADDLKTRQHHVGLKGDWGSIWLGAFDSVIVRFGGFATTDITDQYGGNFEPRYRTKNAVAYISPDLNGFQFGIEAQANDRAEKTSGNVRLNEAGTNRTLDVDVDKVVAEDALVLKADDGSDFDSIGIGAAYSIQGLTFSGAYLQDQGIGNDDDLSQYALGIGYTQDNWVVAAMYGSEETGKSTDAPFLSLAAGVSIDKLEIHGLWEQKSAEQGPGVKDEDETIAAVTARYHLGSKTRLRAGWKNTEVENSLTRANADSTNYALGLRVDF